MQTYPELISSMSRSPIEAQLELFGSLAMASVENAGRLAQFQIDAGRAALDQTCAAWRQLLAARPQTVLPAMSQTQSSVADMVRPTHAPAPAAPSEDLRHATADAPPPPGHDDLPTAAQGIPPSETAPSADDPHASQPPAQRTPIAEAASRIAADGPATTPIVSAPLPDEAPVALPKVKPREATPPPAHSHGVKPRKGLPRK